MTATSGSLELAARLHGRRTILERVRYDGIARCSRAFSRGDAAVVMLSQLGPGVVRGDRTTLDGHLRSGARLIVTGQSATRVLGGGRPASAAARWLVEKDARLELIAEPLVAAADARYETSTAIELGEGASAVVSEIVCVPQAATVRLRTSIRRGGRELFYDAVDAAAAGPRTIGSLAIVGVAIETIGALVATLDAAADLLPNVRIGVGPLSSGVFIRLLADDVWSAHVALGALRRSVGAA